MFPLVVLKFALVAVILVKTSNVSTSTNFKVFVLVLVGAWLNASASNAFVLLAPLSVTVLNFQKLQLLMI